jgi:hypothetical protein
MVYLQKNERNKLADLQKNMKCLKILIILFLIPGVDNSWEMRKNKDNITVYTRKITATDFKELKCVTRVKSSLSAIVFVLIDVNHFTDWIYKCVTATTIKKVSNTEIISYQLFDVPFPFDDRDVVSRGTVVQDPKTKIVTVNSGLADGLVPEKKGVVRIRNFHTSYKLIPEGNGWVKIDYELGTEPGGTIPAWLANMVVVTGPFETQQMMNGIVQNPAMQKIKLPFIAEP